MFIITSVCVLLACFRPPSTLLPRPLFVELRQIWDACVRDFGADIACLSWWHDAQLNRIGTEALVDPVHRRGQGVVSALNFLIRLGRRVEQVRSDFRLLAC